MKKLYIIPLLLVLAAGLSTPAAFAQATGSVKGVVKDSDGKPMAGVTVDWFSEETGRRYTLKTNAKGEYFSLGITPAQYKLTVSKDGKQLFFLNGIHVAVDEVVQDVDLKKEAEQQAAGQGLTPEQVKQIEAAKAAASKETNTVKALNDKLNVAKTASDAGDFDTAIATLTEASQMDATRDLIWFKLGDAYRQAALKQTDPAEKQKRFESAVTDYQKAIDLRTNSDFAKKEADNNAKIAAYYNNLADVYSKSKKMDDAVASYNKAAELDPTHASQYLFNTGATLTNAGKADDAIVAFDKVIAVDPNKADAYYYKGVNLVAKATSDKTGKVIPAPGTEEAFGKYLELQPTGSHSEEAKAMLQYIGSTIETTYGTKKKAAKK